MTLPHALPFGLRDIKLTPYTDATCTALGATVDLPVARTLSFSETEEFTELEGDDETVATHGAGPKVEWELESGGISLVAWAVLSGAPVTETPTKRSMKKNTSQSRPYFKIEGQVISDSGGDMHCEIFRAKCDDSLDGEFSYGEFMLTNCSGKGYGSLMTVVDVDEAIAVVPGDLYRFVQNGTVVANVSYPMPPQNIVGAAQGGSSPAATIALDWDDVLNADSYRIEKSTTAGASWVAGVPPTSVASTVTETGLSAGVVHFRVFTVDNGVESGPSASVIKTIT